ncbi:DNA polymerase I [Nannocystis sp.]|uniref:DNA polymerase I n=1 Tax=Nannocystis sp. TaxID=1962667 RepID=UPI0025F9168C|nr:DNA polymerase I [Nannocystis sp.]MBK7826650.1 DNA polymerase I [Nannocystis sp.]
MSTPAKPQGGPGSVFLIDGSNFMFRAFHALPSLTSPAGVPVNALHGFVRMIQALRKEFAPEVFVAVFDHSGPTFRNALFPDYKAHRPPPPEDLIPQMPLVRGATTALGLPAIEAVNYEADDIIATYTMQAQKLGRRVVILSSDKDLMQLVDDGSETRPPVLLYDTMKQKLLGSAEVLEKWGVPPAQLGDLLALTGDSSDNIPGVPGIGPKTAAGLLAEFGSLEALLAAAGSIKQAKRREVLQASVAAARLSRKLVELVRDVPDLPPLESLVDHGPNAEVMDAFFAPLGVRSLSGRSARAVAAQAGRGPEGPLELRPGAPLVLDRTRLRLFRAADEAALKVWIAAALAKASELALQVTVDVGDATQAHLVGLAIAPHAAAADESGDEMWPAYIPVGHTGDALLAGQFTRERALELLRPLLTALPVWAHAAKFQAIVLRRFGVELPRLAGDPKLASYTLDPARASHSLAELAKDLFAYTTLTHESVLGKGKKAVSFAGAQIDQAAAYACERALLTGQLGRHLRASLDAAGPAIAALFDQLEMPLSRVLEKLEERGVAVDIKVLAAQGKAIGAEIDKLRAEIEAEAGHPLNPDSPLQLQKFLFEERGLEATKKTKTGYSTDAAVLEELAQLDPIVGPILEYRTLTKLKGTYIDTLPQAVNPRTGRLHTSFRQAVAQTGRLSSKDPNLQNIPVRTEIGRRIREAFVAGPGKVLVALDYSQIELRILAHLSGDKNFVSAFRDGVDVHRRTAAEVFAVPEAEVTPEQRRVAKAVNFGVIYGQTAFGLSRSLGIPRGKAGSYIKAYLEKIPGITRYLDELVDIADQRGYAETIFGRRRRIPELARKGASRNYGERIARNTPIQGSAADIMKRAMIAVEARLGEVTWAQMLLTVHDELIFECEAARADELVAIARPLMEQAAELSVPLHVDAGRGTSWAACKG